MNISVSRILPITVVVSTMVLGFKVIALATTSSDAGLRVGAAAATAIQAVQTPRRSVQLTSSEKPEAERASAPLRGARVPVVTTLTPTSSDTLPSNQVASVREVITQGAVALADQRQVRNEADMSALIPSSTLFPIAHVAASATSKDAPSLARLAQVAPAGPASAPAFRAAAVPIEDTGPSPDALKVRRSQIEERERTLVEREALAAASEKRLSERVGELTALQARLQALEVGLKERDEANWSGMVKTYEAMRPKDAALIFNALDKPVLIEIIDRMKPAKATPVIAAMDPEKARQLTTDLAARRTRSTTLTR